MKIPKVFNRKYDKTQPLGLVIGPSNMTGQATRWVDSLQSVEPNISYEVFEIERPSGVGWDVAKSHVISKEMWDSKESSSQRLNFIASNSSHVLFEGGLPISGKEFGPLMDKDYRYFQSRGLTCGVVLHGSDIRVPSKHVELHGEFSPFVEKDELVETLELKTKRLHNLLTTLPKVKKFVTTTDLLDFEPSATWLPVSVNLENFTPVRDVFSDSNVRILHLPSKRRMKGSEEVDRAMQKIANKNGIEYKSITNLSHRDVIEQLNWADIVLDQFGVGGYGVFACEAMAMQRIVVSRLCPTVLKHQPDIPLKNLNSHNLVDGITEILDSRNESHELAMSSRYFVETYHNGQMSNIILQKFIHNA